MITTVAAMAVATLAALVVLGRNGRLGYERVNHDLLAKAAMSREDRWVPVLPRWGIAQ